MWVARQCVFVKKVMGASLRVGGLCEEDFDKFLKDK